MRNLKKVLTLVLTVAMLLSVMVVGTGAAFSDQDSIKNKEAVDACSALNIIAGMEDGSYRPANNVTRAQMCKMICVALNGGKEPTLGTNATPTFSDVRTDPSSSWAESFIESCNSQGIVSGVGGGRFSPSGSVTGTQAARMLLVALGYRADQEGFTGDSWAINVNTLASAKGLYKGIEGIDANAALSRDNAAQMIWNALNAYEVEYVSQLVTDANGNLTSKLNAQDKVVGSNKDKITMMEDKYETESPTGILEAVKQEDGKDTYKITVNVKNAAKDDTYQNGTKAFSKVTGDYSDLLGQDVKVLVKPESNGKDAVVFGVYATSKNTVVTALADDVDDINKTAGKLEINDVSYKTDTANAKDLPVYTSPDMSTFSSAATINALVEKYPYFTVKFVDNNDDDKLDCAIVTPFVPAQIDSLSSSKITLSALTLEAPYGGIGMTKASPNLSDVDLYGNAAEDDYVAVVNDDYTVSGNIAINKMDTVSGKVEATRNSGSEFRTSDSWYTIVADSTTVSAGDENDCAVMGSFVFAVDEVASSVSASNILYIDDVAMKNSGVNKGIEATVYFADGTSSTVTLTKLDGTKFYSNGAFVSAYDTADKVATLQGQMFKFTKKSDSEYEIKTLTQGSYDGIYTNVSGTIKDGRVNSAYRMADDAVVFVTDGSGDTSVKTGKSVSNWNAEATITKAAALTDKSNGYQYAKIACLTISSSIPSSSDYQYGYVTSKVSEIDDDGTKYQFDIWNGTDTVTLTTEEITVSGQTVEKGKFIAYSMDGDLADVELTIKSTSDAVAITGFDEDKITFSDKAETDFADNYVVIGVDTENTDGVAGVKLAAAKAYNGATWANAVYFVDGGEISAVFVDTQGKMFNNSGNPIHIGNATVSNVTLSLTAPVKDAAPATATTNTDGITVTTTWKAGGTAFTGDKFAANTAYTAVITVTANSGYQLNTTALSAAVNGSTVAAADITGVSATGATITVAFPATAAAE